MWNGDMTPATAYIPPPFSNVKLMQVVLARTRKPALPGTGGSTVLAIFMTLETQIAGSAASISVGGATPTKVRKRPRTGYGAL